MNRFRSEISEMRGNPGEGSNYAELCVVLDVILAVGLLALA